MPRPAYLVDTDWIIDHLCGIETVTKKLRELEPEGLAISIISLAELYEGAHYSRDPLQSTVALEKFVAGVMVVPIDEEVCKLFGKERGRISRWSKASDCCRSRAKGSVPRSHRHEGSSNPDIQPYAPDPPSQ